MFRVVGVEYFSNASDHNSMPLASSMSSQHFEYYRFCAVLFSTWSTWLNAEQFGYIDIDGSLVRDGVTKCHEATE